MSVMEKYYCALDERSAQERSKAAEAKAANDERGHSIHLMQASMLGDMLKVLGKVEVNGVRPGILEKQIASLTAESERLKSMDDYDAAERALIKAETIRRAQNLLKEE